MAECTQGVEVRRMWSELEMVRSFGGCMIPGTPDGMFEDWDGALTCVQVVRVPLVAGLSPECMQEVLAQTILTKVVKSQQWLRVCQATPCDFVIFCWLPFEIPDDVGESAEVLMQRVRELDPRFSLRLRVPAQAGALFPALFAHTGPSRKGGSRGRSLAESDVSTYTGSSDGEDEELEGCPWDITWAWEADWGCAEAQADEAGEEDNVEDPVGEDVAEESWQPGQDGGSEAVCCQVCTHGLVAQELALWDDGG